MVGVTGSSAPGVAQALLWEGLNSNGHVSPDTNVTAKNGEPLLVLRDQFMLATFAKTLESAGDATAKDAATAAAAADAAAKDQGVDDGPDIPALALAAGYGDWPGALWPTRAMMTTLDKATKGDKGSPVPWADPKAAPWYDQKWSKGEGDPENSAPSGSEPRSSASRGPAQISSPAMPSPPPRRLNACGSATPSGLPVRCGHAFLSPILARAAHREARPELNKDLVISLRWWKCWLSAPRRDLSRFVPATARQVGSPVISYSDASTDFGLGGVLWLSATQEVFWFRTWVPQGDPIDRLEVEAAAVVDALFTPLLAERGYTEEISFIDNNVSLAWITRGRACADVNPMLAELWLPMAVRGGFKWFERISSVSNVADKPSRGLVPDCPCGWRLREVPGVRSWGASDGSGPGRRWTAF